MLTKLYLKNIALIDSATIEFSNGLNVLSGETGSGKSVIIDSLNFVLGAKAEKSMIRHGENECFAEAVFDVNDYKDPSFFEENGVDVEDGLLIISRKYNQQGKGEIRVNGRTFTSSSLRQITSTLVDVHGQSEHYTLIKQEEQLKVIDGFCEEEFFKSKERLNLLCNEYRELNEKISSLGGNSQLREQRLDILSYQIKEIADANLKEDEEDELLSLKSKLKNMQKIIDAFNECKGVLSGNLSIISQLQDLSMGLRSIIDYDKEYSELYDRIESVKIELDDITDTILDKADNIDFKENELEKIEDRLDLIKTLKRKYGKTIKEVLEFLYNAEEEYDKLKNADAEIEKLTIKIDAVHENILKEYSLLTKCRKKSAQDFSSKVINELKELGMDKSSFSVDFLESDENTISKNGIDKIEFMFSANLGEPLKPLSKIISGGEMSRFMLSLKAITAKVEQISTMIFDEIDTGISGKVAKIVAKKFAKISKGTQVIAISHLPQISAMSDVSLLIQKEEEKGKTYTKVSTLTTENKVYEIVRLIGGTLDNDNALNLANDLIKECNEYKKSL